MTEFDLVRPTCPSQLLYMVLVLGRRKLSLRDLRKSRSGFTSSVVICVCRKDLHDDVPRSQSWQSVNQSRHCAMSEDRDDCLPPVQRWHQVRNPVPVIGDIRRTDRRYYGKDDPGEDEQWQEANWYKSRGNIQY